MGNKQGHRGSSVLDLPPFDGNYDHINSTQINAQGTDSKVPNGLPMQKRHVVNADSGGHRGKVYCLGWAKQDTILCSGSQDGKLLFFSGVSGARVQSVALETSWIKSVDLSETGDLALAGSPDCTYLAKTYLNWDTGKMKVSSRETGAARRYTGHENGVNDVKFTSATNFVTGSGDYRCAYWDIKEEGFYLHAYTGHAGDVQSVAVHDDIFASGSCDCSAKLWDTRQTNTIRTYADHDADVNSVGISSDGKFLVTGSGDSSCLVYDLRAGGTPLLTLQDEKMAQGVESVAFSPQGFHVVAGHENHAVRIWNIAHATCEIIDTGHSKKIGQVAFSNDGKFLAIGSHDQSTSVWSAPITGGKGGKKR